MNGATGAARGGAGDSNSKRRGTAKGKKKKQPVALREDGMPVSIACRLQEKEREREREREREEWRVKGRDKDREVEEGQRERKVGQVLRVGLW